MSEPMDACERCGHVLRIGDFPYCRGNQSDHGPWLGAEEPIAPYFDVALGREVRTRGERRTYMRELGADYTTQRERGRDSLNTTGRITVDLGRR